MKGVRRIWDWRPEPAMYESLRVRALRALAFLLALMVCLTIVSRAADAMTIAEVQVAKPTRSALVHTLEVDGNVEAVDRVPLLLPSGVKISEVLVSEGDRVEEGDLLVVYDSTELQRELSQKRLELEKLQLEQRELEEVRARDLADAEENFEQSVREAEEDYEIAVRRAEANVQAAVDRRQAAQRALNRYNDNDEDDDGDGSGRDALRDELRAARLAVEQALIDQTEALLAAQRKLEVEAPTEGSLLQAQQLAIDIQLKQMDITWLQQSIDQSGAVYAPLGGVVGELKAQAGQNTTGEAALYLTGTAGLRLAAVIGGDDKKLLDVDATVSVNIPGGGKLTGLSVTSVLPVEGETDRFKVIIDLPEDAGLALYGSATIQVARRTETYGTCVPLAALYQEGAGSYYLLVLDEGESVLGSETIVRRVSVQVPEKNAEYAAVEGAVGAGDQVVIHTERTLQDGDRVRLG